MWGYDTGQRKVTLKVVNLAVLEHCKHNKNCSRRSVKQAFQTCTSRECLQSELPPVVGSSWLGICRK